MSNSFTSNVDLVFSPDGALYITEIDESSFLTVGLLGMRMNKLNGSTMNTCNITTWLGNPVAAGLPN